MLSGYCKQVLLKNGCFIHGSLLPATVTGHLLTLIERYGLYLSMRPLGVLALGG